MHNRVSGSGVYTANLPVSSSSIPSIPLRSSFSPAPAACAHLRHRPPLVFPYLTIQQTPWRPCSRRRAPSRRGEAPFHAVFPSTSRVELRLLAAPHDPRLRPARPPLRPRLCRLLFRNTHLARQLLLRKMLPLDLLRIGHSASVAPRRSSDSHPHRTPAATHPSISASAISASIYPPDSPYLFPSPCPRTAHRRVVVLLCIARQPRCLLLSGARLLACGAAARWGAWRTVGRGVEA
ncbi:hypothetical protein C8R45DRAFT_491830 [Mycena sanguinolenta]|nr:hypothetical protein C8R45DRAFT_491830 [Mycena sanguinolenta]